MTHLTQNVPKVSVIQGRFQNKPSGRCVTPVTNYNQKEKTL
jgi:hypothetical protein